jgi:hypothetical protein
VSTVTSRFFNVQWLPEFDRVAFGSLMMDTVKAHSKGVRKMFSFLAVAKSQLASRKAFHWFVCVTILLIIQIAGVQCLLILSLSVQQVTLV